MSALVHPSYVGSPAADVLIPQDAVIIGGTRLLYEFFHAVSLETNGQLALCTPFIDEAFTATSSVWAEMRHEQIDLRVLTKGRRDAWNAWSALRAFRWRSAEIWQCRNLHAKVYSFISSGSGFALVGSHNLTRQGLAVNMEAGVLFKAPTPLSELMSPVVACQEYINRLVQQSRPFADTNRWPRPNELDGQEDNRE